MISDYIGGEGSAETPKNDYVIYGWPHIATRKKHWPAIYCHQKKNITLPYIATRKHSNLYQTFASDQHCHSSRWPPIPASSITVVRCSQMNSASIAKRKPQTAAINGCDSLNRSRILHSRYNTLSSHTKTNNRFDRLIQCNGKKGLNSSAIPVITSL